MPEMRSRFVVTAIDYWKRFHLNQSDWIQSKFKNEQALDGAIQSLQEFLGAYPRQADVILKFALDSAYLCKILYRPKAVDQYTSIGLDAATIQGAKSKDDISSSCLLAILAAEAKLELSELPAGQRLLKSAEALVTLLDPYDVLQTYLALHLNVIRATFAESALEYEAAEPRYKEAMEAGDPLLRSANTFRSLFKRWNSILYGDGIDLIPTGREHAEELLRQDLTDAFRLASLGWSRTAENQAAEAGRQALETCKRLGLPKDRSPLDLRQAITALGPDELDACFPELLALTDKFEDPGRSAAWRVMFHTSRAAVHAIANRRDAAAKALAETGIAMQNCFDAVTLAVAMADLMAYDQRSVKSSDQIRSFLVVYDFVIRGTRNTPQYFPVKAHFDKPVSAGIETAFEAFPSDAGPEGSRLLSVLMDSLRSGQPMQMGAEHPRRGSADEGLIYAQDRIQRLRCAMETQPNAAAIILQSVGDDTIFICVEGGPDRALILARSGSSYSAAARELAECMREGVREPEKVNLERLERCGRAVFEALPASVSELIRRRGVLLLAPDFRSNQEGVPFELFNDGEEFLGLSKIVSRSVSLREMVRILEPRQMDRNAARRAICLAVPEVEGLEQLIFADAEIGDILDLLRKDKWDAPETTPRSADAEMLLDASETASLVHVAAHGRAFAGQEAILLPGGRMLTVSDIEGKRRLPRSLVYLNTCSLGSTRYLGGGVHRGVAYAWSSLGAPCVISNMLPIQDRAATLLASNFYREALETNVGEALRRARVKAKGAVSPVFWGAAILIGDPFHCLPGARAARPKSDVTLKLLDAYTSFEASPDARRKAFQGAEASLSRRPKDGRLRAAMSYIAIASTISSKTPVEPSELEKLARLANELNHPEAEALIRYCQAENALKGNDQDATERALDDVIAVLDQLQFDPPVWNGMRTKYLATRRRLALGRVADEGFYITGPQDEIAEAVGEAKFAGEETAERQAGKVETIFPETSLQEMVWNAVVLGKHSRFRSQLSRAAFASQLAEKLLRGGFIDAAASEHARRITAGVLCFLWDTQTTTYLDRAMAEGQTNVLLLALESVRQHWATAQESPVRASVLRFRAAIDAIESRQVDEPVTARFARAAAALEGLQSGTPPPDTSTGDLEREMRQCISSCVRADPTAGADCAAWLVGLLLEKCETLPSRGPKGVEVAEMLGEVQRSLQRDSEAWFAPYLLEGFRSVRERTSVIEAWRMKDSGSRTRGRNTPARH